MTQTGRKALVNGPVNRLKEAAWQRLNASVNSLSGRLSLPI